MNRKRIAWKPLIAAAAVAVCLGLVLNALPEDGLLAFGQKTALAMVGLQQPDDAARLLSERLDRKPAADSGQSATGGPSATGSPTFSDTEQNPSGQTATTAPPVVVPEENGTGGKISEQLMSLGSGFVQGVALKNKSGKTFDLAKELGILPDVHIVDTSEPQVLILHTHTTESYMPYDAGYYNEGDTPRTSDNPYSVRGVGDVIAAQLQAAGIGVIHDTTIHDSPYSGAYTRSEATANEVLKKYPTIKVVLDVHRDGIMLDSTTKVKPTAEINGKKAAQIMMICGVVSTDSIPHPHWAENFHFALQLQKALAADYRELVRPLSLVASRYNQHVANGALLVEFGSEANTFAEASYSAELFGQTLVKVLQSLHA